jgi:hypothetical protein
MVTRDREIAKSVVYGLRTIISLLRGIRDELADEQATMRRDIRELRQEVIDLWEAGVRRDGIAPPKTTSYEACENTYCALPFGHSGNHRPSLRRTS